MNLRNKLALMLSGVSKKGYTPLKYLESTGTQYIDTGFVGNQNTRIHTKIKLATNEGQTTAVFGSRILASGTVSGSFYAYCVYSATSPNYRIQYGYGTQTYNDIANVDFTNPIEFDFDKRVVKVNGTTVKTFTADTFTNPSTILLFNCHTGTSGTDVDTRYNVSRIYFFQIYDNGTLVRDFIPALDENGIPCMWDRVQNKPYYNQGTGSFNYEEWDFTPCDCVYANGNAYCSTLCYGNSDTKMEMVFDIANQSTYNRGSMGSRGNSANSQLLAVGYGTSVLASDFNNSSYSPYRASITYDLNTKYRVYTSKEKRSIIDEATGTVLDENNTLCTNNMSTGALLLGAETGLSYRHVGNIYGAKIWDGNTVIRDYIPAVDGNNKGCFYDKCTNTLFYSIGSSDFVGHFIQNGVDYKVVKNIIASQVATSGNTNACPYIKTGIYPSSSKKTRMKVKTQIAVVDTSYDHFLGGTNADSRFVFGQASASSSSKFYFGLGTQNFWTTQNVDTSLHIFGLDWATETCSIDDTTWQIPSAGTSTATKPFFINARSTSTHDNANRPGGGTSYWWKFWNGNKLIYNGIPVIRTTDNKAGLFETVNREFQTTAGTIDYTYTE